MSENEKHENERDEHAKREEWRELGKWLRQLPLRERVEIFRMVARIAYSFPKVTA